MGSVVKAKNYAKIAEKYAKDVLSGKVDACEFVKQACQRHFDDLEDAKAKDAKFWFDSKAANRFCKFVEQLPHVKGEWAKRGELLSLEPWQCFAFSVVFGWKRAADNTRRFREAYIEVPRKNGKGLALDTPIPTPSGWTLMGDIVPGDTIYDERGTPCRVEWVSEDRRLDCYLFTFSNGEQIVCDGDHLWLTTARVDSPGTRGGRKIKRWKPPSKTISRGYVYANLWQQQVYIGREDDPTTNIKYEDIVRKDLEAHPVGQDNLTRVRTAREIFQTQRYGSRGDVNHSLQISGALECAEAELPVHPYILGVWLGDGNSGSAVVSCGDEDILHLETEIKRCGYLFISRRDRNAWRVAIRSTNDSITPVAKNSPDNLQRVLRNIGVLGEKHIPKIYLRSSKKQRIALLQGIMDTDGTISKDGKQLEFVSVNRNLAYGVAELLSSLGIKYSIREKILRCNGVIVSGTGYSLIFSCFIDELPVFRLKRKLNRMRSSVDTMVNPRCKSLQIVSVEQIETVTTRCISVDSHSHLFLCGRTMVPTHNSAVGAGTGLYMFAADGEEGAEVFSGATTEKQAWEVFGPARIMADRAEGFKDYFGINVGAKNLSIPVHACKFEPVIGKPGDGSSPHCAIVDEYHEHQTPDLYDTMITGQGARSQPLLLIITTAGTNIFSPCYSKRDQVKRVLSGKVENDELFGIIYTIDPKDDWTDIKIWRKANPNFGVSVSEDFLRARLQEALQNSSRQNIIKCKHLNVWSNARESWMNMHDWEQCCDKTLKIDDFEGKKCIISFDMAETTDVMAIGVTFFEERDGKRHYVSFSKFYLPETQIEDPKNTHYMGWYKDGLLFSCGEKEIDNEQIQDELIELHKRFDVVECVYDPWHAHDIVNYLEKSGLSPVKYLQQTQYLSPAMKEVTGAVSGGRFAHAPNKMMDWMMGNVVCRVDAKGEIFPRKEKPEFKIDGAVTLIMGVGRAMMAPVKSKSVYEERGFLTLGG